MNHHVTNTVKPNSHRFSSGLLVIIVSNLIDENSIKKEKVNNRTNWKSFQAFFSWLTGPASWL